jgi:hypothetical protein
MDRLPELLAEPRQVQVFQPLRGDFRFTYSGATESASQMTAA